MESHQFLILIANSCILEGSQNIGAFYARISQGRSQKERLKLFYLLEVMKIYLIFDQIIYGFNSMLQVLLFFFFLKQEGINQTYCKIFLFQAIIRLFLHHLSRNYINIHHNLEVEDSTHSLFQLYCIKFILYYQVFLQLKECLFHLKSINF